MRRGVASIVLVAATAVALPASAPAATTLGHTQSSNTACAAPNTLDVQTATGPGQGSYAVPAGGGVITGWQHEARDIDGALLKLKVVRPTSPLAGPASFSVVGETPFWDVAEPKLHSYPARIKVQPGDRLGIVTASNAATSPPACNTNAVPADEVYEGPDFATGGMLNPFNTFRLNIAATLEPDADNDGFGDETQDKCRGKAGAAAGCPASKKKCKKKKKGKGRSAAAAKKKKCGKRKKK
jgi:hypothetical protein